MAPTLTVTEVEHRVRRPGQRNRHTRVFVFPTGESILDHFANRRSRPIALFRQAMVAALPDLDPATIKAAKWSQTAGCSCPCSPGFILPVDLLYDVFVTFRTDAPVVDPAKADIARAVAADEAHAPARPGLIVLLAREYVEARDAYIACDDDENEEPCDHWHRQHEAYEALALAAKKGI